MTTPTTLVVEALREAAALRSKVAHQAAAEVRSEKKADPKRDTRSSAVKVTELLADAAELDQLASKLDGGELILASPPVLLLPDPTATGSGRIDDNTTAPADPDLNLDPVDDDDEDDDPDDPDVFEVDPTGAPL